MATLDTSGDRIKTLHARLTAAFQPSLLEIDDDSAAHAGHAGARSGGHYQLRMISTAFSGQSLLQRHRMIYAALGDLASLGVHALAIQARSPEDHE